MRNSNLGTKFFERAEKLASKGEFIIAEEFRYGMIITYFLVVAVFFGEMSSGVELFR